MSDPNNFFRPDTKRTTPGNGLDDFAVNMDEDSVSGATVSKRRAFRRKRNRIRRIVLISISVLIGILLALITTDMIKIGTGPQPSFENSISVKKNLM